MEQPSSTSADLQNISFALSHVTRLLYGINAQLLEHQRQRTAAQEGRAVSTSTDARQPTAERPRTEPGASSRRWLEPRPYSRVRYSITARKNCARRLRAETASGGWGQGEGGWLAGTD